MKQPSIKIARLETHSPKKMVQPSIKIDKLDSNSPDLNKKESI